ncbi:MAG: histidine kinase [Acidimicrobiia bacterium]
MGRLVEKTRSGGHATAAPAGVRVADASGRSAAPVGPVDDVAQASVVGTGPPDTDRVGRSYVTPRPSWTEADSPAPPRPSERFATLILAFRWSVLAMSLVLAIAQGYRIDASLLVACGVLVANAAWRTVFPIDLEAGLRTDMSLLAELALSVAAVLAAGGWESPFFLCLATPIMTAGLIRGYRDAGMLAGLALASITVVEIVRTSVPTTIHNGSQPALLLSLTAIAASYARSVLEEVQVQHERVLDETTRLATANHLLLQLHDVTQSLPSSLDLGQVMASARAQFREHLDYTAATILVRDEATAAWRVELADGVRMPATVGPEDLPGLLRQAAQQDQALMIADLLAFPMRGCAPLARSALAVALRARGQLVGFATIEHNEPDRFGTRDAAVLTGMADALALTIDNALWFARIRTLAAEAERARIARDLHDHTAQSLAYVGFELERMARGNPAADELVQLRDLVRSLVLELRENLFQLRVSVSETRDLETVIRDYILRYQERTGIHVALTASAGGHRLPVTVEQELWRITQEALTNVERHARATEAWVTWRIAPDRAWLEIRDNGVGFDRRDVPKRSLGLTGMRERADAVGACLNIDGAPGSGTRILVELEVEL